MVGEAASRTHLYSVVCWENLCCWRRVCWIEVKPAVCDALGFFAAINASLILLLQLLSRLDSLYYSAADGLLSGGLILPLFVFFQGSYWS